MLAFGLPDSLRFTPPTLLPVLSAPPPSLSAANSHLENPIPAAALCGNRINGPRRPLVGLIVSRLAARLRSPPRAAVPGHRQAPCLAESVEEAHLHPGQQGRKGWRDFSPINAVTGMDLSQMLAESSPSETQANSEAGASNRPPPAGRSGLEAAKPAAMDSYPQDEAMYDVAAPTCGSTLAPSPIPKHVTFELLLPESPQHRARLPMRVNINPHDTTESIITTVKNFYGLYENKGVSFEDRNSTTLIARYENFENNMVVYVRVIQEKHDAMNDYPQAVSPRKSRLGDPFPMPPPHMGQPLSRPSSRTARRSLSPTSGRGRRSASASTSTKPRPRVGPKSRGSSIHSAAMDLNAEDYSDSDGGNASVTSSRREQVASADISLDNIVEGGRRKRAKFDSSELPLFVPPQVPMSASISSISPQRRMGSHNGASPFSYSNQQTFSYNQPLPSPQSYGQGEVSYMQGAQTGASYSGTNGQPHGHRLRTRGSAQYVPGRHSQGSITGVFPTPDPTIGSVISDEDVALQLMRLGDASNFSSHGRTSTSTLDDAFSGKAEHASSAEESDDGSDIDEQELHAASYPRSNSGRSRIQGVADLPQAFDSGETSGEEYEDNKDGSFKGESDEVVPEEHEPMRPKTSRCKPNAPAATKPRAGPGIPKNGAKPTKARAGASTKGKLKTTPASRVPMSPTSLPPPSRKTSNASINFQHQLAADEEDLSTKPRCQRCRKSKKGCDRQRPCQRCKDAGIGIEGCISEDEGNGRKGRYGRHMGVPVKKEVVPSSDAPIANGASSSLMAAPSIPASNSKKRKR